jgi:hyperosmotically inducible protein
VTASEIRTACGSRRQSFEIKVETRKGQVQLSGFVDTQERIDNAIARSRASWRASVASKCNAPQGRQSDRRQRGRRRHRHRQGQVRLLADPGIKSFDIAVTTRKGEVKLTVM